MSLITFSKKRLQAFLDEIDNLEGIEFPYKDSESALSEIRWLFEEQLEALDKLTAQSDPDTVGGACASTIAALYWNLPLLGLIVRSAEVRNAFEVHGPLKTLSASILGEPTELILSSEWDYSPFTYIEPMLGRFVMIGLPATESSNPLLLPLAGHELGHRVWFERALDQKLVAIAEDSIVRRIKDEVWTEFKDLFPGFEQDRLATDLDARATWGNAATWALRQAEETFCDFLGLRIFAESYLHAFAYLLAPQVGGYRSGEYPNTVTRITNLLWASDRFNFPTPVDFLELFEDSLGPSDRRSVFLLGLADSALAELLQPILEEVEVIAAETELADRSQERIEEVRASLDHIVPAKEPHSLCAILCAGWDAFLDGDLWKDRENIRARDRTLKELLLKSIEVLEVHERLRRETAP